MPTYKIIREHKEVCEKQLNAINETHWIIIHGLSTADSGLITMVLEVIKKEVIQ